MMVPARAASLGVILSSVVVCGLAGAARPQDPDPFRSPPDSLTGRHARIAVTQIITIGSSRIPAPDASTDFARRICDRLKTAGFSAIAPESVLAGWKSSVTAGGGLFDPRSGRPDSARFQKAESRMHEWLRDSTACDLWLRYRVLEVSADYDGRKARWDGYETDAGALSLLPNLLLGSMEGKVGALSLEITISDLGGASLYARRAGLQLRARRVKGHWIPVPLEGLEDEALTRRALDRSLGPWLDRVAPRASSTP